MKTKLLGNIIYWTGHHIIPISKYRCPILDPAFNICPRKLFSEIPRSILYFEIIEYNISRSYPYENNYTTKVEYLRSYRSNIISIVQQLEEKVFLAFLDLLEKEHVLVKRLLHINSKYS